MLNKINELEVECNNLVVAKKDSNSVQEALTALQKARNLVTMNRNMEARLWISRAESFLAEK